MGFFKSSPVNAESTVFVEAAGLAWLAEAMPQGGARVVGVLSCDAEGLELERIEQARPTAAAAEAFGAGLARTHRSLAAQTRFGELPPDHPQNVPAYFGPADQPLEMGTGTHSSWGEFHARERLDPLLARLRSLASADEYRVLEAARDRLAEGAADDDESPSRIHGDLWAGNVLWTPAEGEASGVEAVLIDPAAHAGHRETDIALLHLFGLPHLDAVLDGYEAVAPLREGWKARVPVHQFFCLAAHWVLFGSGYRCPTMEAAGAVLDL